jgi:hypothetical protein
MHFQTITHMKKLTHTHKRDRSYDQAVSRQQLSSGFIKFTFTDHLSYNQSPGSVVGIATAYGLDGPGIESRWGARFSAPVQTGPKAHPASYTMGTGSFPGVRCGRGVTLTPHPLLLPRSKIE